MNYWLVKSEPDVYHFETLLKEKETMWDGVRNNAARLHLKAMKKGDLVLYYHSGDEKQVVGIAKVTKEWYPEPNAPEWAVVTLVPQKKLKKTVTLKSIKANKKLAEMKLIKISRLSVVPVTSFEFDEIINMSES
ncbi:MAG: EVE domain-containing protein [Cyclobacteriaceae bacterium]|jgi:predicted RNA-binding protein with PUA-like domain|nr:EVE domain-containing protein [Flammeovirgaceae bacterium]MCZ8022263.1 EVE domain-containing protein [Cytophagales bacterium]MCZ8326568.1 EVE domain-containing protein [Cyclobacteriaceae bacterium]